MSQYILKRLLLMIPTLLGVALLVFLLLRVAPGDIVELKYAGSGTFAPKEALDRERAQLGLDKPVAQQFVSWISGVVRFDFGASMWTGQPITQEIKVRLELSLELAVMATLVAMLLAIPLGTLAALKQDTWVDYAVRIFSIAGLAMPSFWLGIVTLLGVRILFKWLPPLTVTSFWVDPRANLAQLIWPALAVGYRYSAMATRMTRSAVLEVLRDDYVRTARAKGLSEAVVVLRHALRNALLPIVTVIGLEFAFLIGGLV
ncbi:MAG: ABC transporter permease, partial [Candidatus Binatia bacterium]